MPFLYPIFFKRKEAGRAITTKDIYDAEATKYACVSVNSQMDFMKGINEPFIHVTKPKMKNNPAIIDIGTM